MEWRRFTWCVTGWDGRTASFQSPSRGTRISRIGRPRCDRSILTTIIWHCSMQDYHYHSHPKDELYSERKILRWQTEFTLAQFDREVNAFEENSSGESEFSEEASLCLDDSNDGSLYSEVNILIFFIYKQNSAIFEVNLLFSIHSFLQRQLSFLPSSQRINTYSWDSLSPTPTVSLNISKIQTQTFSNTTQQWRYQDWANIYHFWNHTKYWTSYYTFL